MFCDTVRCWEIAPCPLHTARGDFSTQLGELSLEERFALVQMQLDQELKKNFILEQKFRDVMEQRQEEGATFQQALHDVECAQSQAKEALQKAHVERQRAEELQTLLQYEKFPVDALTTANPKGVQLFNEIYHWNRDVPRYKGFERVVGFMLEAMTGKRALRQPWQDGGADLILCHRSKQQRPREVAFVIDEAAGSSEVYLEEDVSALAQCKLFTGSNGISVEVVRELVGARCLRFRNCLALDKLYVVTSHYLTKNARAEAALTPIVDLIDRDRLMELFEIHYEAIISKLKDFNSLLDAQKARLQREETPTVPAVSHPRATPMKAKTATPLRKNDKWSSEETLLLYRGVVTLGFGRSWATIEAESKKAESPLWPLHNKDQAQLKDKWRLLQKKADLRLYFEELETQLNFEKDRADEEPVEVLLRQATKC